MSFRIRVEAVSARGGRSDNQDNYAVRIGGRTWARELPEDLPAAAYDYLDEFLTWPSVNIVPPFSDSSYWDLLSLDEEIAGGDDEIFVYISDGAGGSEYGRLASSVVSWAVSDASEPDNAGIIQAAYDRIEDEKIKLTDSSKKRSPSMLTTVIGLMLIPDPQIGISCDLVSIGDSMCFQIYADGTYARIDRKDPSADFFPGEETDISGRFLGMNGRSPWRDAFRTMLSFDSGCCLLLATDGMEDILPQLLKDGRLLGEDISLKDIVRDELSALPYAGDNATAVLVRISCED